jgi:hypothetical protein
MDELCEPLRCQCCHHHGWHMLARSTGKRRANGGRGIERGAGESVAESDVSATRVPSRSASEYSSQQHTVFCRFRWSSILTAQERPLPRSLASQSAGTHHSRVGLHV